MTKCCFCYNWNMVIMSFQIIKLHSNLELHVTKIVCQICLNENYKKKRKYNYTKTRTNTTIFPLITKHACFSKVFLVTETKTH